MRRSIQDRNGTPLGTIAEVCSVGQALAFVVDDRGVTGDERKDEERTASITIHLPLLDARWVSGKRVAIFPIEE